MISVITHYVNIFFHLFDVPREVFFFLNKGYRAQDLFYCYEGLLKTNQYFLSIKNNSFALIEGRGDDLAQYYFIPKILYFINAPANLLYIEKFQIYFYVIIVFASFLISLYGLKLLNRKLFIINIIYLILFSFFCLYCLSTVTFNFFILSFTPLTIYFINKYLITNNKIYFLFFASLGLLIGLSNTFRSFSGTGLLLFISIYILLIKNKNMQLKNKICILSTIFIFSNFFNIYFDHIIKKRNDWLTANNYSHVVKDSWTKHTVWSDLYIGFGYVFPNKYKIYWEDQCAIDKANQVAGSSTKWTYNTMDSAMEEIIKKEVLKIAIEDPFFVFKNLILKTKKVMFTILWSLNVGLLLFFLKKTDKKLIISALVTILFYSVPPILVWPDMRYCLGGICMSVFLTIFMLNDYLMLRNTRPSSIWD